jgi:hypothetical protein
VLFFVFSDEIHSNYFIFREAFNSLFKLITVESQQSYLSCKMLNYFIPICFVFHEHSHVSNSITKLR